MSILLLYALGVIALGTLFARVAHNALRTGLIWGANAKPLRRDRRPQSFAIVLAVYCTYSVLSFIGAAFCVYSALFSK